MDYTYAVPPQFMDDGSPAQRRISAAPHRISPPPRGPIARWQHTSPLAIASLLIAALSFIVLPLNLLAIAFGLISRRNIRASRGVLRGEQLAFAGIVLGCVSLVVTAIAATIVGARLMSTHQAEPNRLVSMAPLPVSAPIDPPEISTPAPTFTHAHRRSVHGAAAKRSNWGTFVVSDIDPEVASLTDALDRERAAAENARKQLLVLLVDSECATCTTLEKLLLSEPLQRVLSNCWVVRLDVRQFDTELQALGIPIEEVPAFVLLSPENTPLDYIHRGEWEPRPDGNIAPILHDFLRGKLAQRRYPWGGMPRDEQTPL
ncbi:MAG TPA: DUF4190 domain-containing protein [Polyangiaceae bacterium]|nr:DUF4190 domain-containing protein [Polyangiaceae bacterium]